MFGLRFHFLRVWEPKAGAKKTLSPNWFVMWMRSSVRPRWSAVAVAVHVRMAVVVVVVGVVYYFMHHSSCFYSRFSSMDFPCSLMVWCAITYAMQSLFLSGTGKTRPDNDLCACDGDDKNDQNRTGRWWRWIQTEERCWTSRPSGFNIKKLPVCF